MSRRHLELARQGPILVFKDLGSKNGTFLNGNRIDHSALAVGDVLRVGHCVGVVCEFGGDERPAPSFAELNPGLQGGATLSSLLEPARRAARSMLPILILGETGSGKECVGRAIHAWSGRKGPFLAINCAALPETLAEAELFGYRRGAFTGSERSSLGLLRAAEGGTLLLDEAGELSLPIQAKLLRVLEQREVVPLGETSPVPVDVRLLTAGQLSLRTAIDRGAFREDLYARIAGMTVETAPLRKRREDLVPLFRGFLEGAKGEQIPPMTPRFVEALCLYDWPRNVRELKLTADWVAAVHGGEAVLRLSHLPECILTAYRQKLASAPSTGFQSRHEQDLHRLTATLKNTGGNLKAAAAALGMSRARAYRLLGGRSVEEVALSADDAAADGSLSSREKPGRIVATGPIEI